jgi:hypothetical protein
MSAGSVGLRARRHSIEQAEGEEGFTLIELLVVLLTSKIHPASRS